MKRRHFSPEEKMAIILTGLKGEQSIAEICREHQISQSQYYKWRDRFLEAGKKTKNSFFPDSVIPTAQRIVSLLIIFLLILRKTPSMKT